MPGSRKGATSSRSEPKKDRVVHIYQVRPEMALEHLKRTTGLDFESLPESLVNDLEPRTTQGGNTDPEPPILTDVVERR